MSSQGEEGRMIAAGMSGSMAETSRKSVGLGFDSRHVITFFFLSNLVSCTGEHLAMESCMQLKNHLTALHTHTRRGDFTSHVALTARVLNRLQHSSQPIASHIRRGRANGCCWDEWLDGWNSAKQRRSRVRFPACDKLYWRTPSYAIRQIF